MKSYLVLFAFLVSLSAFAQSSGKIKKYGIVSSKTVSADASGKEKTESIERYDSKGRLVYVEEYNKKGVLKEKAAYKYNKKGLLIEESSFDEKGQPEETVLIDYQLELPVKYTHLDPHGQLLQTTEVKYNGFKEKTQEITYDAAGKLIRTSTFEYDNKGLKTKKTTTDDSGAVIEMKIYSYEFE